jgi:hypothetical protein
MCWVRPAFPAAFAENTLLLISGVSYVLLSYFLAFLSFTFGAGSLLRLRRRHLGRFLSASAQRGALGVSHKQVFTSGFVAIFWGVSRSCVCVCVCVAFERRKGEEFSTSIGTRTGLPRHQLFRRSLSTNLFLCVWEGRRQMDGWMEKSDLFDWLYRGLFYLIGYARLAITIWKDADGRKERRLRWMEVLPCR